MLLFPLCAYLHRLRTRAFAHLPDRLAYRVSLGELVDARYRLSSGTGTGTASDDLLVQGFRLSRIDADHEHNTPHG